MEIENLTNYELVRWFEACCNGGEVNSLDPLSIDYLRMFKKIESEILHRMKG